MAVYTFEDLCDPDRRTWLGARWTAEFDPTVRDTMREVEQAYAGLAAEAADELPAPVGSDLMDAMIRGSR